jgi:hypothetical protein
MFRKAQPTEERFITQQNQLFSSLIRSRLFRGWTRQNLFWRGLYEADYFGRKCIDSSALVSVNARLQHFRTLVCTISMR